MKSLIEVANEVVDRHLAPTEVEAPATAADILRRAAYRVAQPGAWCQYYAAVIGHSYYVAHVPAEEPDQTCMMGAIQREIDLAYPCGNQAVGTAANDAIIRVIGTSLTVPWNDAPERTQDQVVAALIRASEIEEAQ